MLRSIILFCIFFLSIAAKVYAESKLYMLTDDKCMYCIVWEKQIGKIYAKTDISKKFPLHRIYVNEINKFEKKFQSLTDEQLKGITQDLKEKIKSGKSFDSIKTEALCWYHEYT